MTPERKANLGSYRCGKAGHVASKCQFKVPQKELSFNQSCGGGRRILPAQIEIPAVYTTATESDAGFGGLPSENGNRHRGSLVFGLSSHIVEREASTHTVTSPITFILEGTYSSGWECRGETGCPVEIRLPGDTSPVNHFISNVVGQIRFSVSGGVGSPQGFQGKDLRAFRSKTAILQGQVSAIRNETDGRGGVGTLG